MAPYHWVIINIKCGPTAWRSESAPADMLRLQQVRNYLQLLYSNIKLTD